ncbi:MAG TPA: flagellar biosynthesis anti-sigma factor FlgM [Pyrinomonadaceae bacterium]|jgi:negative regulator of flagellin synthesis FlgM|nr:flagellar biosynthesis anti-sigma factor FlgM [Pyrinomonadaceae bacterium]
MVKVNRDNLHNNDAVSSAKRAQNERTEKTGAAQSVPSKELKVSPGKDKVELSGKSAEFSKLVDQVKQLPDIRHDRVNELKQKIASGNYEPSAEDIADAILNDEK